MWWLLAAALVAATADATDKQSQTIAMPSGKALAIDVTIGNVRIEGWDKDQAEIVVERHAPSASRFTQLPLAIEDTASRITVRATQPDAATDPALRADIAVKLPRQALIERIGILEGRLSIAGFSGSMTAEVRRGPIDGKDVAGTLRLSTEIGAIVLAGARLDAAGLLRLRTFNGDVRVSLATRPANARILALALNGVITSDIPLTLRDGWGPRWGEATLGTGAALINLDVVTGAIEIKVRN